MWGGGPAWPDTWDPSSAEGARGAGGPHEGTSVAGGTGAWPEWGRGTARPDTGPGGDSGCREPGSKRAEVRWQLGARGLCQAGMMAKGRGWGRAVVNVEAKPLHKHRGVASVPGAPELVGIGDRKEVLSSHGCCLVFCRQ